MKLYFLPILLLLSTIVYSQSYHDTQGKLEITNSGQASYTLPIAMPPSIKSVAPVINLVYSSGQRGGIAGQGWNISSISSISRMSTRVDIDGFRDGVDFDDNDKLALDGQRLLLKTGTYWGNGSTYETEYKSNTRIQLVISGIYTLFTVTYPDGSQAKYGNTNLIATDYATSLSTWSIKEFKDTYGNTITYNYTSFAIYDKTQNYIDSIAFSGNSAQAIANLNTIKFNYRVGKSGRYEVDFMKGELVIAFKILDNVQVFTNNTLFRKYQLTQFADDSGYERVSQIQEFNGAGDASNPVLLTYDTTSSSSCQEQVGWGPNPVFENRNLCPVVKPFSTSFNFNGIQTAGDFNGDGQTDFVSNNNLYTGVLDGYTPIGLPSTLTLSRNGFSYSYGSVDSLILPVTTATNNKLNQFKSIVGINETASSIKFRVHNLQGNVFNQVYEKNISINNTATSSGCQVSTSVKNNNQYFEGDFNGDGISEILMLSTIDDHSIFTWRTFGHERECFSSGALYSGLKYSIIDLNINSSTTPNSQGYSSISNNNSLIGAETLESNSRFELFKRYVADFNGDGKSDLLRIDTINKTYLIITFKQLSQAPWSEIEILGQGTLPNFNRDNQILFGDYNGDGKVDILIPFADGSDWWKIYFANPNPQGGSFFREDSFTSIVYKPYQEGETWHDNIYYYAMDINKDGKSDLVTVYLNDYKNTGQYGLDTKNWDSSWRVTGYTNHMGKGGVNFTQTHQSPLGWSDNPAQPIQFATSYKYQGQINDVAIINGFDHNLKYYKFDGDFNTNNRLKTVSEANGKILQTIDYLPMQAGDANLGTSQDFYSSTNTATYPNIEIIKNSESYLVSKLTANINGVKKFQDFKYRSLISNFEYGSVGFARTARSSWYTETITDKIWTVQNNDPNLRGANTITWSTTNGDNVFAATPTNLLSTKTNEFEIYTNPTSKQYNVLLKKQTTLDHLTTIKNETLYTYDGLVNDANAFGLQTKSVSNTYLGTVLQGTTTVDTSYLNNASGAGNAYFIGKPSITDTSTTIYPNDPLKTDTRTSKELYTYTGPNLTKTEKRGHNATNAIFEEMTYDSFGNLLTKKLSCPTAIPALASRTITDEYDTTKRFVIKKTDHQGFVTLFEYNSLGQVSKSTNYLGVISSFVYDNWGKQTSSTTTGASQTTITNYTTYAKLSDGGYTTTSTNNVDAAINTTQYDVLGQMVKSTTKGFASGTTVSKSTVYDILGRKLKEYEPYFTSPGKFTEYKYDYLQRPIEVTATTGRIQTLSYTGLTTTSIDNTKTTSATMDALGSKVKTSDEGGTINFKYYANGQLKESDYGGHKITIAIDGWGNKISMNDPNAGTYTYVTDEFGQSKTETTPKGATNYTYDDLGKLITKTILGTGADFVTTYTYNGLAQVTSEITKKANNDAVDSFLYTYDSLKRLEKTTETNSSFTHSKTLSFDSFSRLASETNLTTDTTSGFSATVVAKSNYNVYNGIMDKMTDVNNAVLWQLNSANAKMQTLTATLGNGVVVNNVYDANSYFMSQRHQMGSTDVLYNTYNFDAVRGTLNNRKNIALSNDEIFTYDNLDRLTRWGTPSSDQHLTFDTSDEGFIYNQDPVAPNQGQVIAVNGLLDVNMVGTQSNIQRLLRRTAVIGQTYKIRFEIETPCTGLFVTICEKNPLTGDIVEFLYQEIPKTDYEFNTIEITHKVTNYRFLYFKINSNRSGLQTNCQFKLDNLKIESYVGDYQSYDERGRIKKNELGNYQYGNSATTGMYRKTAIDLSNAGNTYYSAKPLQTATYTMFKSPMVIKEGNAGANSFGYNSHLSRTRMQYGWSEYFAPLTAPMLLASASTSATSTPTSPTAAAIPAPTGSFNKTKFYTDDGSTEIIKADGKIRIITYIGGNAYSAPLYNEKIKNLNIGVDTDNNYYLHRDHLGSIIAISNSTGVAVERRHFDAWGNLTKLQQNGVLVTIPNTNTGLVGLMMLDRGYTSHEHLAEVGLIQMNGRLYDPVLHTFMMPDNFVQQPENTQNYNRYAYVLNNPLMYTDPSGEFIPLIVGAILIGAAVSAATYYITCLTSGQNFSWGGLATATFIGAASAAVTFGIGCAASSMFSTPATGFLQGAYQGAIIGSLTGIGATVSNAIFNGNNLTLKEVLGGAATGAIMGGIFGGIRAGSVALEGDASFWTGNKTLDTSKGVGAHSAAAKSIVNQGTIRAKYAGKYEGVNVYEHKSLGIGIKSGGLTLPPNAIIVGKGTYAIRNTFEKTYDLFKHEFGHILESREPFVGVDGFYKIIAPESLATSNTSFADSYWTETWANHLSKQYFGYGFYDSVRFPVKDISAFNRTKFLFK